MAAFLLLLFIGAVCANSSTVLILDATTTSTIATTLQAVTESTTVKMTTTTSSVIMAAIVPGKIIHTDKVTKEKTKSKITKTETVTKLAKTKTTPAIRLDSTEAPAAIKPLVVQAVNTTDAQVNFTNATQETQETHLVGAGRKSRQFGLGFGQGGMGGVGFPVQGIPAGGMMTQQISQPFGFGGPVVQDTVTVEDTIVGKK